MSVFEKIWHANRKRSMEIFPRRLLKLGEEYGEASQAYLSISSEKNGKNKTWEDVREELTDCIIVAMDLYCHEMPDEENVTLEDKVAQLNADIDRKLKKWDKKQKAKDDLSE